MTTTATNPAANIVRSFASRDRRPTATAIRAVQVQEFHGGTAATATDLEVACTVTFRDRIDRPAASTVLLDRTGATVDADFPAGLDEPLRSPGGRVAIDFRDLRRIGDHVAVAAADENDRRYCLGGVLLEMPEGAAHIVAVATDGRRLHAGRFCVACAEGTLLGASSGCIVPARVFAMTARAIRAAAREGLGVTGRRLDAAVADSPVVLFCDGREVVMDWGSNCGRVFVRVRARLIEGRFPRWRDCCPDRPEAIANGADWSSLAAWCRVVVKQTREAAEAAGEAAAAADKGGKIAKQSARARAIASHPRGVAFLTGGAEARGCGQSAILPAWVSPVTLDPAFAADAAEGLDGMGHGETVAACTDPQSAVVMTDAGWRADAMGFLAVIMPMAAD
jgi:hypothetical protein